MQYDENAEKYGYEGEMTPMKCDELKEVMNVMQVSGERIPSGYYKKSEVDEAIAELKDIAENACLECDDNQTAIDELQAENAELKAKLENVQASMYCDVVDANMENRRLRRALWLERAERAKAMYTYWHIKCIKGHLLYEHKWIVVERKCRAKAEKFKEANK